MKKKIIFALSLYLLVFGACTRSSSNQTAQTNGEVKTDGQKSPANDTSDAGKAAKTEANNDNKNAAPKTDEPRTVRAFFALLPDKYFTLEGCDRATDKNCDRARAEYLSTFLEVEDTANGYLKAGCDGAQSCLTMALFKRPDGKYLVALNRSFEMGDDYFFLDYTNGKWTDVSAEVVPEFSKKNMYELPRVGTTIHVFAKKIIEQGKNNGDDYEITEKGAKIYDLEWKEGKFTKK